MPETWQSIEDVAERLKIHPQTVRKLIRSGDLVASRIGKRGAYRIAESDLLAFMETRKQRPDGFDPLKSDKCDD